MVNGEYAPILGRKLVRLLHINLSDEEASAQCPNNQIFVIKDTGKMKDEILMVYHDLFEPIIGKIPGAKCTLNHEWR